jgi:hypothetical protein
MGRARGIGLAAGLVIASLAILAWRIPPGNGTLGTDLIVAAVPTGEIQVVAPGPFLTGTAMHPGSEAHGPSGTMTIHNISAMTQIVRVNASVNISDLDRLLWLDVESAGRRLFRGPVGRLRHGSPGALILRPGASATLVVRAWLPTSVSGGYEGRIANVDLSFVTSGRLTVGAAFGGTTR